MGKKKHDDGIWVTVRVQRGFVSDINAFSDERSARRQEASWRRQMNPDYDETAISYVHVSSPTLHEHMTTKAAVF